MAEEAEYIWCIFMERLLRKLKLVQFEYLPPQLTWLVSFAFAYVLDYAESLSEIGSLLY